MSSHSISRRLIVTVLLLELLAALALVGITVFHESRVRFRSFDVMLRGRADSVFGAVGDADDPADSVILDTNQISVPKPDIYDVEEDNGNILGRSANWPAAGIKTAEPGKQGIYRLMINGSGYHFVRVHGLRVVDPGEKKGGVPHQITVFYGAPTRQVWHEVREAVSFYAIASILLLAITGFTLAWFLRRGLAPLHELADEAGRVSADQWQFNPPQSARDTRELAPLAHAMEAALGRLQLSLEQQRRFTSDAAHELKTDVAIVKSSIQLLAMRPRSTDEYAQGLNVCLDDCVRLEGTVQEMLTLAGTQYAAGQGAPSTAETSDLASHARTALSRFAAIAQLRQVHPIFTAPESIFVALDAKECTLLCSNLLLNAIQHSHPGSEIKLDLLTDGASGIMAIQDFGEGIEPDVLPHVFEPFFRGDQSRARKTGGTGLGLAICKAICDKAGGSIEITSSIGQGTRVLVRLPARFIPL